MVLDFQSLVKCRDLAVKSLKLPRALELSMGMSSDYKHAVSGSLPVQALSNVVPSLSD